MTTILNVAIRQVNATANVHHTVSASANSRQVIVAETTLKRGPSGPTGPKGADGSAGGLNPDTILDGGNF